MNSYFKKTILFTFFLFVVLAFLSDAKVYADYCSYTNVGGCAGKNEGDYCDSCLAVNSGACYDAGYSYECRTGGTCSATGHCNFGTTCEDSSPETPSLSSPADDDLIMSYSVDLTWNGISNWGENCTNPNNKYLVEVNAITGTPTSSTTEISSGTTTMTFTGTLGTTYEWRVTATNGALSSSSGYWTFSLGPGNDAQCIGHTIPLTVITNNSYDVSVTMENSGVNTWVVQLNNYHALGSSDNRNNLVWGLSRIFPSRNVPSGSSHTFDFIINTPSIFGNYSSKWEMVQEVVEWFGETCGPDDVFVDEAPDAYITASPGPYYDGDQILLSMFASDQTSDLINSRLFYRCLDATCGGASAWSQIYRHDFASTGSEPTLDANGDGVSDNSYYWTPAGVGNWQVTVVAFDAYNARCSGRPGPTFPIPNTLTDDCDSTPSDGTTDLLNITVLPAYDLDGYILSSSAEADGSCIETPPNVPAEMDLSFVLPIEATVSGSGVFIASFLEFTGYFNTTEVARIPQGGVVTSVCPNGDIGAPVDESFFPVCAELINKDTGAFISPLTINSDGCIYQDFTMNGNRRVLLGFEQRSLLDGWFTSIDGDVFTAADLTETMPTNPLPPELGGYILDEIDADIDNRGFVFSGGNIDVRNGIDTEDRISQSESFLRNLSGVSFLPENFGFYVPSAAISISGDANTWAFNPGEVYVFGSDDGDLSDFLNDTSLPVLREYGTQNGPAAWFFGPPYFTSTGVTVIYVQISGGVDEITLDHPLFSYGANGATRKLILVSEAAITVDTQEAVLGLGYESPTIANINSGTVELFSSEGALDILLISTHPNGITFVGNSSDYDEKTAILRGSVIATNGPVVFEGDRGIDNEYPVSIVKYNPFYLYQLTKQIRDDPSYAGSALSITDVEWSGEGD